jgi:tetratricopeptide (TPR) repeat protein
MAIHPITRALIATCILSIASFAQTAPAQNPPAAPCPAPNQTPDQAAKPCPPPAVKKPSAAEQFPFPGETAKPANPPANAPDSPAPSSSAPDSPAPSTTPSDAAAQHPFPTQTPPKLPGDDSSSSSSRSPDDADTVPGDDSATKGDNPPEGTSVHRKLPKVKRVQTDDERVDEDLNVAKFYFRDENYQGAYLRAKDAINVQPDYSTPHFVLAQIAQKMKKKDEAITEYQTYLKLDPEGEKAKEAHKALAELQPSGSH